MSAARGSPDLTGLTALLYERHLRRVLQNARVAVEIGPGTRPLLPRFPDGFRRIGVDLSLSQEAVSAFDECHEGRADELPFATASIDAIVGKWVLEHVEYAQGSIDEIARVLKPGGAFVFMTPNRNYPVFFGSLVLQKILPFSLAQGVISSLTKRRPADVYRSFYRLSTKARLERMWLPYGNSYIDIVEGETVPYGVNLRYLTRGPLRGLKPFLIGRLERGPRPAGGS